MSPQSQLRKPTASIDEGPYPLYDFTSSGMTHNNAGYAEVHHPYRVVDAFTEKTFCADEIDRPAQPAPTLHSR